MGPVEKLLREAGELMRDESKRCAGHLATDRFGLDTHPCSAAAVRWCAEGSLSRGCDAFTKKMAFRALERVARDMGHAFVSTLNDRHPELIDDMFSEAIEAAAELKL